MSDRTPTNKKPLVPGVYGPLEGATGYAKITGPCGDTLEFWVLIEAGRIQRCTFTTDGCQSSRACGTSMCRLASGALPSVATALVPADVLALLPNFPEDSKHCALLAVNTLRAAIANDPQTSSKLEK